MEVREGEKKDGKVTLEVSANADDVNKAFELAELDFARSMGLMPEPGKSIGQIAEQMLGVTDLDSIIVGGALGILVSRAIDAAGIYPAYPPQEEICASPKRGEAIEFSFAFTPKPEYELTSYDPVEIMMPPFFINEAEVDEQLGRLAERSTIYADVDDRPLVKGDTCVISITCDELPALATESRTYVLGKGYMPSGFDEDILGMEPGETREFSFEVPSFDEDHVPIMKQVDCTVTLKAIQEPEELVIDDQWVKSNVPGCDSVEDLRKEIRNGIEERDREQYENYKLQLVANALSDRFDTIIPDEIYMNVRSNMEKSIQAGLARQGKTWDEFVMENGGESQVNTMLMLHTRENAVRGFVLDAIFRHEGLTIDDDDIEAACLEMNPQVDPRQLRQRIEDAGQGFVLREAAERAVANKWAADHAKLIDPIA